MAKRSSLVNLADRIAGKPGAASEAPARAEEAPRRQRADTQPDGRKGVLVRLPPAAWKQLRRLAVEDESTLQDEVTRALNEYFQSRDLPPIA